MLVLHGCEGPVRAMAYSPDGRLLAAGGDDMKVRLWDLASGELLFTLSQHTDWVRALAFSPDGQLLASGGWNGKVVFHSGADWKRGWEYSGPELWSLAFAPGSWMT